MIRVLIADDHPAIRSSLVAALGGDSEIEVVGQAGTAAEAARLVHALRPDVLVLDIDLPDRSGADLAADLRDSPTRVLAFTAHTGKGFVEALARAGAQGYVTKDQHESELVAAVKDVGAGRARWLVPPPAPQDVANALTPRETDVLTLLVRGLSNPDIAATLFVSESTVRNTLTGVYQKAGVQTARQAIAWAVEHGYGRQTPLLEDPPPDSGGAS